MGKFDFIGTSGKAIFSQEVVTGKALYTGDMRAFGMLVGKALYANQPHARIHKIDTRAAKALAGVKAVLTHADVPGINTYQYEDTDQPVLVIDKIRYQGDVLAIVAAETEAIAQAAIDKIMVETEPLLGVFDPLKAADPGAPRLSDERDNTYKSLEITHGDLEGGFAQADYIIENVYTTPWHEHAYLEPESVLVCPRGGWQPGGLFADPVSVFRPKADCPDSGDSGRPGARNYPTYRRFVRRQG